MKIVTLISGGIDSPVATYLMLDKGCGMIAVHMDNKPYTDEKTSEKVKTLLKTIAKNHNTKIKLYIAKHGPTQKEIIKKCDKKLTCILCKRFMYRTA
ncbi:MAG: 7-cyano-7-deazaguanine synthase, partial [Candidatus Aenigmarchaeota archaeon]|nr:7-cyano-7-deazaguanine synthase [Candidatus Aenigmarchaeota archaeon]